jgi:hypothetical protein
MTRTSWVAIALLLTAIPVLSSAAPAAAATVPSPTFSGPVTGGLRGEPMGATPVDLARAGYSETEYFFTGTARSASGGANAAYTSRVVVRRPVQVSRFNGTVVVEWYNVTDQSDNDFDWHRYWPEIVHDGFAFVAVSVQLAGIPALKAWDPIRYAPISHPGDDYAFDIFAQAVQGLRAPLGADPLGGLHSKHLLATGDSQSADELTSYINQGYSARNHNVDGYMIDSGYSPAVVPDVPVLENATEGDIVVFGAKTHNQGRNYVLWDLPGASHVDHWELAQGRSLQTGLVTFDPKTAGEYGERGTPQPNLCPTVSDMFPGRYMWDAGLAAIDRWVRTRVRPTPTPLISVQGSGNTALVNRDQYGNALGGLRYPTLDVPVATYIGGDCFLYGTTLPLDALTLSRLYPTHQDYVDRMAAAIARVVNAGYMLRFDGEDLLERACASDVGGPSASARCPHLAG